MNIFRQQAVAITKLERIDSRSRASSLPVIQSASISQNGRSGMPLRAAEIIRTRIPHTCCPAAVSVHGLQGTNEFRVIWFNQAEFREQQDAGVEVIAANRRGKGLAPRVPGLATGFRSAGRRNLAPGLGAIGKSASAACDRLQRWQPAQHIAAAEWCGYACARETPRSRDRPRANCAAFSPRASIRRNRSTSPIRGRRRSKNIGEAARMMLP